LRRAVVAMARPFVVAGAEAGAFREVS
jgi:hypothetical protein